MEKSPFLMQNTPLKFNSSPLKNGGWKTTFLLGRQLFRVRYFNFEVEKKG